MRRLKVLVTTIALITFGLTTKIYANETNKYETFKKSNKEVKIGGDDVPSEVKLDLRGLENIEYLKLKTDSIYEIALACDDGTYEYVSSADDISKAMEIVKNEESKKNRDRVAVIINEDGLIIYATEGLGRVVKIIDGQVVSTYDTTHTTNLYKTKDMSGKEQTSINHAFIDDVVIVEDSGDKAKIEFSGYTGWINKYDADKNINMIVVPINQLKSTSYYKVNSENELVHYISTDITNNNSLYPQNLGPAPSFMKQGEIYFSYDGNYFYNNLRQLIADASNGNHNNATNTKNVYYNYYLYLPGRSKTTYTAKEINNYFEKFTPADSLLRGTGEFFKKAEENYGVNAAISLGIAMNESEKGTSKMAKEKLNLFGSGAIDGYPQNADKFSSIEECISRVSNWSLSNGFFNPKSWKYNNSNLGNKGIGANVRYATDPFWGEKAANRMYEMDEYLSGNGKLRDFNEYSIGMYTGQGKVVNQSGSALYSILSENTRPNSSSDSAEGQVGDTTIILNESDNNYNIQPDRGVPINVTNDNKDGTYIWSRTGYIDKGLVKIINNKQVDEEIKYPDGVIYQTHVQDYGWQTWKSNGEFSGTEGKGKRLEGIKINLNNILPGANIVYRTHVQDYGWQVWKKNGEFSGTEGESKRLEGIEIKLENAPGYSVEYKVHVQDYGWQDWKQDGLMAGTQGKSKRLEGIEIRIVKSKTAEVIYKVHVQDYGWQDWKRNGELSGTEGLAKRLEGIEIKLEDAPYGANILYRTHVQDYGWQGWKRNGEFSGTEGESRRLEGIEIKMENAPGYDIMYRTHVQDYGWQGWKKSGEFSGTEGQSKRLEAIEIKVIKN